MKKKKIHSLGLGSVEQGVANPDILQVEENQAVVLAQQHAQPLRLYVFLNYKKHFQFHQSKTHLIWRRTLHYHCKVGTYKMYKCIKIFLSSATELLIIR